MSSTRPVSGREEYDPIMKGPEYEKLLKKYKEVEEAKKEAEQLQPIDLITEAPEGYYYEAEGPEGYKEYNRQVLEYNKALREYKAQVQQASLEVDLGLRSLRQFEETRQTYFKAVAENAPQRTEFLRYVATYGPPTPQTEQDREALKKWEKDPAYKAALGDYLETVGPQQGRVPGIPGPGMGPAPGSVSARVQPFMQEAVGRMDVPFKTVTQPLRQMAENLERQGLESAAEGKALVGFANYAGSVIVDTAAMGFDVATFEARPQLWAEVGRTLGGVTFDPEVRGAAWKEITYDPFRFVTTVAGGAYIGGVLQAEAGKLPSRVRQVKARYDWSRYGDEALFTASEAELGFQYPEETITYEPTTQLYKRAQLTIYDRAGLVKEKLPYYIEAEPEFIRTQEIFEAAEEWSPTRVSGPESYYALPFDETGSILVKGRAGMKPIKEPTLPPAPRSEAIQVVSTEGVVSTPVTTPVWMKADTFLEHITYEPVSSYLKPVNLKDILAYESIRITEPSFSLRDLGISASALKLSDKVVQRITEVQRTNIAQIETQLEKQLVKTDTRLDFELGLRQPVSPAQIEVQVPDITQRQIQGLKFPLPQIQVPEMDMPTVVAPKIPRIPSIVTQPPKPPRKTITEKSKTKKKRRPKGRKRGIFELRVDIPEVKLPKEPKL